MSCSSQCYSLLHCNETKLIDPWVITNHPPDWKYVPVLSYDPQWQGLSINDHGKSIENSFCTTTVILK